MVTRAIAEIMIFIPNMKTMMMKLMRSLLENIMKSKSMKKHKNLPVQYFENVQ